MAVEELQISLAQLSQEEVLGLYVSHLKKVNSSDLGSKEDFPVKMFDKVVGWWNSERIYISRLAELNPGNWDVDQLGIHQAESDYKEGNLINLVFYTVNRGGQIYSPEGRKAFTQLLLFASHIPLFVKETKEGVELADDYQDQIDLTLQELGDGKYTSEKLVVRMLKVNKMVYCEKDSEERKNRLKALHGDLMEMLQVFKNPPEWLLARVSNGEIDFEEALPILSQAMMITMAESVEMPEIATLADDITDIGVSIGDYSVYLAGCLPLFEMMIEKYGKKDWRTQTLGKNLKTWIESGRMNPIKEGQEEDVDNEDQEEELPPLPSFSGVTGGFGSIEIFELAEEINRIAQFGIQTKEDKMVVKNWNKAWKKFGIK